MNHQVILAKDNLLELEAILKKIGNPSVFLVSGKKSFIETGAEKKIIPLLEKQQYYRFTEYSTNPKIEEAVKGVELFKKHKCTVILAVGGGSAIDVAKAICVFISNPTIEPKALMRETNLIKGISIPFIAIPTTSGSGSEATHFAVIYDQGIKYSIDHQGLLPKHTILHAALTHSMNSKLTAVTGLDALCQAIESYWSVNATTESKTFAIKSLHLVLPNLIETVTNPNMENRKAMQLGAYWAGRAINISKTTAPHAFSYYLTTNHGIPHGQAVALWMPLFLRINKSKIEKPLLEVLKEYFSNSIETGFKELGTAINLELDIKKIIKQHQVDVVKMLESVNIERLKNNPASVNIEKLKKELQTR